jgi:hypothetical protein
MLLPIFKDQVSSTAITRLFLPLHRAFRKFCPFPKYFPNPVDLGAILWLTEGVVHEFIVNSGA